MEQQGGTKRCTKCGEEKPVTAFSKKGGSPDSVRSHCKLCVRTPKTLANLAAKLAIPEGYKKCSGCGETKLHEMFFKGDTKDGLRSQCKDCHSAYHREHAEQISEQRRGYRASLVARETVLIPVEKRCSRCLKVKPWAAFAPEKSSIDGLHGHCRSCKNASTIASRRKRGMPALDRNRVRDGMKRCNKCGEVKTVQSFFKKAKTRDGLDIRCKTCHRAYLIDLATNRRLPDDLIRQCAACGEVKFLNMFPLDRSRVDGISSRCRACKRRNGRAYRNANLYRHRAYAQNRRALKLNAPGRGITEADIQAMIYVQQGLCAYCERDGKRLTLDHVIPLFQGGMHDPDNGCMCCGKCNFSKGPRTPEQWKAAGRWFDRPLGRLLAD